MKNKLVSVILCGGSGSRLWPISREQHPKPFIQLPDGESLIQKAFLSGSGLPEIAEIIAVTNKELGFKVSDAFTAVNQKLLPVSYVLEPFGRNTAAAVAVAALLAQERHGEDAHLLVLAADHLISDRAAFNAAIRQAITFSEEDFLVTFGIRPTQPETAYGYLETEGHRVARFVEKPTLEKAQNYLISGNYLWNAGIFCFRVGTVLREMATHCPDVLAAARESFAHATRDATGQSITLSEETFQNIPDISIDYALMERANHIAVVPCDIGWSDLGSWTALSGLEVTDAAGNAVVGEAVLHNSHNCYIHSDSRMIGVSGVENLIVVDTSDALLVADKSNVQNVKYIYNELKSRGHETYKHHRSVQRPWGSYTVLEEGDGFKIKRIVVNPGAKLSLQSHRHRSEHWVVVAGSAIVVNGDERLNLSGGQSTYITVGSKHRLENPGTIPLVVIEVQTGSYLGEDDIVRYEDQYGRCDAQAPKTAVNEDEDVTSLAPNREAVGK
ncbi:MAG: mannose-1-phosphate guanylyltransferase/mannose-6-phosphate isomerase [Burkholderiales bacterium]|nr:mannose-1-phosphate guanylyltransferase/mannose-6-phosphate isomerase [Burkholderiales bacterium]